MAAQLAVAPDRPPVAGDQEPNANNVDDDQMDDNSQVSSSDEDWEHSVATSAIDPSDESSEAHNEDVDDEVYFIRYFAIIGTYISIFDALPLYRSTTPRCCWKYPDLHQPVIKWGTKHVYNNT